MKNDNLSGYLRDGLSVLTGFAASCSCLSLHLMPHTQDFLERRSLALKLTSRSLQNLGHGFQGSFSQSQLAGLTGISQTRSLAIFREPELVPFPMQQRAADHLFKTSAHTTMAWAPSWAQFPGFEQVERESTTQSTPAQPGRGSHKQKHGARVVEGREGLSVLSFQIHISGTYCLAPNLPQ